MPNERRRGHRFRVVQAAANDITGEVERERVPFARLLSNEGNVERGSIFCFVMFTELVDDSLKGALHGQANASLNVR